MTHARQHACATCMRLLACLLWPALSLAAAEPGTVPANDDARNFEGVWTPSDGGAAPNGTPERAAQLRSPRPPPMRDQESNLPWTRAARYGYLRNIALDVAGTPRVTNLIRCRPDFDLVGNRFSFTVFQTPAQVTLLFEEDHAVRRIFIGGRHPAKVRASYHGHSVGHWDGDTLVIDTIGYNDRAGLILFSPDHSTQLHTVERIRKTDGGHRLEDRITVTDPALFTAPVQIDRYYTLRTDLRMQEFICEENEREALAQGTQP